MIKSAATSYLSSAFEIPEETIEDASVTSSSVLKFTLRVKSVSASGVAFNPDLDVSSLAFRIEAAVRTIVGEPPVWLLGSRKNLPGQQSEVGNNQRLELGLGVKIPKYSATHKKGYNFHSDFTWFKFNK